jgi:radical SAM superfamily enzyme YgiQ (UPF0313 family)
MNKNIVLVYPKPYENLGLPQLGMTSLPMSLLYLASASRKICDDIVIFDFNINDNDLNNFEKVLLKNLPQVVGINCMFSMNFKQVLSLSVFVKNKIPESRVVIGGIHPTIFAEQIMQNCSSIDAIVLGEGDAAFPRLLEYYFSPPPPPTRQKRI